MVDGDPKIINVKLFQNLSRQLEVVVLKVFLFLALVAILSSGAEQFEQFW